MPISGDATMANDGTLTIANNAVTSAKINDGEIINADINAAAAIDATKIADGSVTNIEFQYINTLSSNAQTQVDNITTLADGTIYLGDVANAAQEVALSGDVTMTNAGVVTIANNAVTTAKILDDNVTLAKLVNGGNNQVLTTDGAGNPQYEDKSNFTSSALTSTHIYVGDALGVATDVAMSGDATMANDGTLTIANNAVTLAKMDDMATSSLIYRKTAGIGAPEVQTLATLKTDLGLTGTNSGDQTSIVGITGTLTQFNTALTDEDFVSLGGTETLTNKTLTSPTINTATIAGGTINNTPIGSTTASTGAFTTLSASGTTTLNGAFNYGVDATSGNDAYAITLSPAPTAYVAGMMVIFKAGDSNVGACTINVNGLGVTNIKRDDNSGVLVDLADDTIDANGIYILVYDSAQFVLIQ